MSAGSVGVDEASGGGHQDEPLQADLEQVIDEVEGAKSQPATKQPTGPKSKKTPNQQGTGSGRASSAGTGGMRPETQPKRRRLRAKLSETETQVAEGAPGEGSEAAEAATAAVEETAPAAAWGPGEESEHGAEAVPEGLAKKPASTEEALKGPSVAKRPAAEKPKGTPQAKAKGKAKAKAKPEAKPQAKAERKPAATAKTETQAMTGLGPDAAAEAEVMKKPVMKKPAGAGPGIIGNVAKKITQKIFDAAGETLTTQAKKTLEEIGTYTISSLGGAACFMQSVGGQAIAQSLEASDGFATKCAVETHAGKQEFVKKFLGGEGSCCIFTAAKTRSHGTGTGLDLTAQTAQCCVHQSKNCAVSMAPIATGVYTTKTKDNILNILESKNVKFFFGETPEMKKLDSDIREELLNGFLDRGWASRVLLAVGKDYGHLDAQPRGWIIALNCQAEGLDMTRSEGASVLKEIGEAVAHMKVCSNSVNWVCS